ncbi:uncharacterized protein DUF4112 [Palleronia aestuarii]|uniref:Uncharacterized protein DUF4112 n=1 Tax=Palleronia aestuarii TaxID=568105 RepID=A0A2W7NW16_9RHOB|nr:DUF4112 domain-containing protein [Palleronia aestuarii]PZX17496.1 uncharacterized protein DUF4112 [Palleronia aestuarii]
MTAHPHMHRLERLERLASRLDSAFRIPGTKIRFGYDPILGLLPGVGDVAALVPGVYIINESRKLGVPTHLLIKQGVNMGIDTLVGSIPLLGSVFDVGFRANRRNVALLRKHLEDLHGPTASTGASPPHGAPIDR